MHAQPETFFDSVYAARGTKKKIGFKIFITGCTIFYSYINLASLSYRLLKLSVLMRHDVIIPLDGVADLNTFSGSLDKKKIRVITRHKARLKISREMPDNRTEHSVENKIKRIRVAYTDNVAS